MSEENIGIMGGDDRQACMANLLAAKGYTVYTFGVVEEKLQSNCHPVDSLTELLNLCHSIIGPVPLTKGEGAVPSKTEKILLEDFLTLAAEGTFLYAGCLSELVMRQCESRGIRCYDYMKNERVAIYNSIATAEGTILELLANHPANIHGSKCLITGYGRCARALADRLLGLHGKVTICARSERDREEAITMGYKAIDFSQLKKYICSYEYIINTVPALVLPREIVGLVCQDSLIVDIASVPGGVDFKWAKKMGIPVIHALGLPGKYAPLASARLLTDIFLSL